MSRKSRKQASRGNIALCVTIGVTVGLGLGRFLGNVLLSMAIFGLLGLAAGWYFTRGKKAQGSSD